MEKNKNVKSTVEKSNEIDHSADSKLMIAFPPDFINKIGEYMSQKPWNEVNHLLDELKKGIPVNLN